MKSKSPRFEPLEKREMLTAYLVEDINQEPNRSSFPPFDPVQVGDFSYFSLEGENGSQLWRSDGTEEGTSRLGDFDNADRIHLASNPDNGLIQFICLPSDETFHSTCTLSSTSTDGERTTVLREFDPETESVSFVQAADDLSLIHI